MYANYLLPTFHTNTKLNITKTILSACNLISRHTWISCKSRWKKIIILSTRTHFVIGMNDYSPSIRFSSISSHSVLHFMQIFIRKQSLLEICWIRPQQFFLSICKLYNYADLLHHHHHHGKDAYQDMFIISSTSSSYCCGPRRRNIRKKLSLFHRDKEMASPFALLTYAVTRTSVSLAMTMTAYSSIH